MTFLLSSPIWILCFSLFFALFVTPVATAAATAAWYNNNWCYYNTSNNKHKNPEPFALIPNGSKLKIFLCTIPFANFLSWCVHKNLAEGQTAYKFNRELFMLTYRNIRWWVIGFEIHCSFPECFTPMCIPSINDNTFIIIFFMLFHMYHLNRTYLKENLLEKKFIIAHDFANTNICDQFT